MPQEPRLDRLSALLESLLPRVWVQAPPERPHRTDTALHSTPQVPADLNLHILTETRPPQPDAPLPLDGWPGLSLLVCLGSDPAPLQALERLGLRRWVGFGVAFDGPTGPLLLRELAAPEHIRLSEANPSLAHIVQLMATELQTSRCGQPLLMNRAGDIVLIGLLRHLVAQPGQRLGLFRGLADPRMARALVAIHTQPGADWTLDTLAAEAGMSRTAFAVQFKATMATSPGKYLEGLRLALAQRLLNQGHGLKRAAQETGYASPATLSRALSRAGSAGPQPAA